jgi:hypothetical protein
MQEGRAFAFLDRPSHDLVWNETIRAFAQVVEATGDEVVRELLACEVPFFATTPITGPLDHLEHVIHPKRFDHEALLSFVSRRGVERPPRVEGLHILSIRGGRECVVWFTKEPAQTLATFERAYAEDRQGTLAFLQGLKRGL